MKKSIFLVFLISFSCTSKINKTDLHYLNGYWEIEKVVFPDGEEKEYTINEIADYIQIDTNNRGYKLKVIPQLDGNVIPNAPKESFAILEDEKGVFRIHYTTKQSTWEEELLTIKSNSFVVKNSNDIIYYYKRKTIITL